MKTYYISIDLDVAGIEAKNEEEAYTKAHKLIKDRGYALEIVDTDDI